MAELPAVGMPLMANGTLTRAVDRGAHVHADGYV